MRLASSAASSAAGLRSAGVDGPLEAASGLLAAREQVDLALQDRLAGGQLRELRVGPGQGIARSTRVLADEHDVGEHGRRVALGLRVERRHAGRGARAGRAPVVRVLDGVGHLCAQRADQPHVASDVARRGVQLGAGLLELRGRLVVTQVGGLGLLAELVDARLHGVDVLVVGGCSGGARESETHRGEHCGDSCNRAGMVAFPAVEHERSVSSLSRRLPGQLTDSGPKNALPARSVTVGDEPRRIHPKKTWVPGSGAGVSPEGTCSRLGAAPELTRSASWYRGTRSDTLGKIGRDTKPAACPRCVLAHSRTHQSHPGTSATPAPARTRHGVTALRPTRPPGRRPGSPSAAGAPAPSPRAPREPAAPRASKLSSGGGPSRTVTTQS